MSTNALLFGALFLLASVCLFFLIRLELRLKKIFKGKRAGDLESLMRDIADAVSSLHKTADQHEAWLGSLSEHLKKHGRGVHLVRFNPFPDVGGNQSFAVAVVNEKGDGVVFSSLYSRERQSLFAKPLSKGTSDVTLTPEETHVIEEARKDAAAA